MRRLIVVIAALALCASAYATNGISGVVTDYTTGVPIYHACLAGSGLPTTYTDSSGGYFIYANPGHYTIWTSASGHENGIYPESIHVVQGQVTDSINFALISYAGKQGIGGRLTDGRRELGIGGGIVIASGQGVCDTATSVTSGGYVISGLAVGKYEVKAEANGFQPMTIDSVQVDSAQVKWCPFYMYPESLPPMGIAGRVTDYETGNPIYHASLAGAGLPTTYTDSNGVYYISANPGHYTIWGGRDGYENGIYPESITVVQDQVTDSINFAFIKWYGKTGIGGRLTDVSKMLGIGGGTIIASGHGGCDTATSVPTGGYVISGLAAGKYQVSAEAEGFQPMVYPDSVTVVSNQVTWTPFYMEPESTMYGCMGGNVTNRGNGASVFGALITATSIGRDYANTGTQGSYTVSNLPPGKYLVTASAAGFDASVCDTVDVTAGHTVSGVNFSLQSSSSGSGGMAGGVADSATLKPIAHARVFVWGSKGQSYAYSDSIHGYSVNGLADGWYRVRADVRGYFPTCFPESVEVAGGQITGNIDLRLRAAGSNTGIAGFVYDGFRQVEIPGAHVRVVGPSFLETNAGGFGDYLLTGMPAGDYIVEAEASGYKPGNCPDQITVVSGGIASFASPALYPATAVAEPRVPISVLTPTLVASPNPARGAVRVQWEVARPGLVKLRVFDNTGRIVRTIQNAYQAAGHYSANWNGVGDNGRHVANGIFFYRLDAPGIHNVVKVAIVGR
ncbi:MAG TPA: carboxypeptidase regulatory-like domain-containing protein [bacterium]|nr:carboxypeptidase regulatory-like domain-containing protein [bacterium]